jgi:glycosyltransferase involved in cell wall biosynthesis
MRTTPVRTVSCVVPAHNEALIIAATIRTITDRWSAETALRLTEVLIVDDGSRDATADVVRALAASVPCVRLLRQHQQGKGAALRNGVLHSSGDIVYFVDADLPFGPDDHVRLASRVSAATPVVCGYRSRNTDGRSHSSFARHAASTLFSVFVRVITGLRLRNSQCGLKAFDGELARRYFAALTEPGFAMDVELLARMRRDGVGIAQHPVVLLPEQRTSSVSPLRTGLAMTRALFRIRRALRTAPALPAAPAAVIPPSGVAPAGREPLADVVEESVPSGVPK